MTRQQVLETAIKAAIKNGCERNEIDVPEWAKTYSVTQKAVRDSWKAALTSIPPNSSIVVEGK